MASRGIKALVAMAAGLLLTTLTAWGSQPQLHEGDLLFACADSANAITTVTTGAEGLPIDHVGIMHWIGGEPHGLPYVIEAIHPVVCLTPLDTFVRRTPCVLLGRMNEPWHVTGSISRALREVGKPYDDLYLPGDSALYCSELVLTCYVDSAGSPLFCPTPMTFRDNTGKIPTHWQQLYQSHGMEVPEGVDGSNPGELSRRRQITLIDKIITTPKP